jgi:hypothetical protein
METCGTCLAAIRDAHAKVACDECGVPVCSPCLEAHVRTRLETGETQFHCTAKTDELCFGTLPATEVVKLLSEETTVSWHVSVSADPPPGSSILEMLSPKTVRAAAAAVEALLLRRDRDMAIDPLIMTWMDVARELVSLDVEKLGGMLVKAKAEEKELTDKLSVIQDQMLMAATGFGFGFGFGDADVYRLHAHEIGLIEGLDTVRSTLRNTLVPAIRAKSNVGRSISDILKLCGESKCPDVVRKGVFFTAAYLKVAIKRNLVKMPVEFVPESWMGLALYSAHTIDVRST